MYVSPQILRQRKLLRKQLKKELKNSVEQSMSTVLGHSLALRKVGYAWRDLITLRHIDGMQACSLKLARLLRLNDFLL
jgi:hypothetical protein